MGGSLTSFVYFDRIVRGKFLPSHNSEGMLKILTNISLFNIYIFLFFLFLFRENWGKRQISALILLNEPYLLPFLMCIELCILQLQAQRDLIVSHHISPAPCRDTTYQSRCRGCRWHIERLCAWNHRCSHGCHICLNSPPDFGGSGPPASQSSWLTGPPRPPPHWRPSRSHRTPGFKEM